MSKRALIAAAALIVGAPAHGQDRSMDIDPIFAAIGRDDPGCAAGVAARGQPHIFRSYGLADLETRAPITERTAFDIASVHKQFVAASVLLLAEENRLDLSDDIRAYVPELPSYGPTITLDHLLTHTSGLRDWVVLKPFADDGAEAIDLIVRQRGVNFAPGEEWSYSNSGYVLLKEVIARVSGMSFAEFSHQRIFEPLGMTSSAYVRDILQVSGDRALAYRREGDGWRQDMLQGAQRGGGGVASSVQDLLIWNEALATSRLGAFVTEKMQEQTVLNNGRTLTYARGLNAADIPGERLVSHSGGGAGYSAWLGRFMNNGVSTAVLCNFEPVSATALAIGVSDLFLPPVSPDTPPPGPEAAPGVDVSQRAGVYFDEQTGEPLNLVASGGRLAIAGKTPLVTVNSEKFLPPRRNLFYRSEDAFELVFLSSDVFEIKSMEGQTSRYRRAASWTPSATDVVAFEGRYGSDELGAVVEIVPTSDGLAFRSESRPDRTLEFKPVARDTFMYLPNAAVIRFRRNAAGEVVGIEQNVASLRSVTFLRLGDRNETSAPIQEAPAPAPVPPAASVSSLQGFAGEYQMAPGRTVAISFEDGRLFGEPGGGVKRPLTYVSGTTFTVDQAPIMVTFVVDADGLATAMTMDQNGRTMTLPRVR